MEMSLAHSQRLGKARWQKFGVEREVARDKFEEVVRKALIPGLVLHCKEFYSTLNVFRVWSIL